MIPPTVHLTYKQAAEFLNVRVGTLYSMVSKRQIPHLRIGRRLVRFSQNDLQRFLAERLVAANTSKGGTK